jgi:hypothetical protein
MSSALTSAAGRGGAGAPGGTSASASAAGGNGGGNAFGANANGTAAGGGAGGGTSGGSAAERSGRGGSNTMPGRGAGGSAGRGKSAAGTARGGNSGGGRCRHLPNKNAKKPRERDGMAPVYRPGAAGSRIIVRPPRACRDQFATANRSLPEVSDEPWRIHPIDPGIRLRIVRHMPDLPALLEAEVERLWQRARARDGGLFNGRVFSADRLTPALIEGHWTEYRRIVARMARPELAADMPVAPTAVGGTIVGDGFVVFGRRPAGAVYQAGQWQLPPAGSLDPSAADGDEIDPVRQLLAELREELGLPADAVREPRPLCVVEHPGSGVLDLGIALRTHWTPEAILDAHTRATDKEYDPLEIVALSDLPDFLARRAGFVTRQAFAFLAHAKLLAAA